MREIFFIGKRFDNGEWIKGDSLTKGKRTFIGNEDSKGNVTFIEIDPETIDVFFELPKKAKKEIVSLEDAIAHCYEVADDKSNVCEDCKAEHMMLGAWLKELKLRREKELHKPLAIGDEVWVVLEDLDESDLEMYKYTIGNNAVSDITQIVTEVGERGFWIDDISNDFKPYLNEFFTWDELGESVFFTREEAEQALKEREENEK